MENCMEQNMNSSREPSTEPPTVKKPRRKPARNLTVRDAGGIAVTEGGLAIIRDMARLGHPVAAIAGALGMSRETLNQCRKRQPEVADALDEGLAGLEHELVNSLLKAARSGNVVAAMFLLKCRHGYRETGQTDSAPKVAVQINLPAAMGAKAYAAMIEAERQEENAHG